jgi:hypothetical protein
VAILASLAFLLPVFRRAARKRAERRHHNPQNYHESDEFSHATFSKLPQLE